MRWTISLLVGIFALSAAPSASAMGPQTVTLGHASPAVRAETGSAPRRHAAQASVHATRRVGRNGRPRTARRTRAGDAPRPDAARHADVALGGRVQPERWVGAGRPALAPERPHRLGADARAPGRPDPDVGAGR